MQHFLNGGDTGGQDTRVANVHTRERLHAMMAAARAHFRYQPQIDLQTGRIAGVESVLCVPALDGYRPATRIVAEIDSAGLGILLAELQIREACCEQRTWLQSLDHEFPVAVPVSKWTLANPGFLPLMKRTLEDHGLAPSFLELETGESALGMSVSSWCTTTAIRDAGMQISIDGFVAASANLRLLAMMPISKLRVSATQLLRNGDGGVEKAVFDAILGAARGLGILVCATGVDSPEILAAVLRQGRPLAQGVECGPMLNGSEFLQCLCARNETTATLPQLQAFGSQTAQHRDEDRRPERLAS